MQRTSHSALTATILLMGMLSACLPRQTAGSSSNLDRNEIPEIHAIQVANGEPLNVVTTTNLIGHVVRVVGGEHVAITVLIEPGQDPHSFQPVPVMLSRVEEADLVFVNGFDLEESLLNTLTATATGPIIPVSAGIEPLEGDGNREGKPGDGHVYNPHVWMDPALVSVWAGNIAQALAAADPAHADAYHANALAYMSELDALDAEIRQQAKAVPQDRRRFVTDHNTLAYFARAYDFQIAGTLQDSVSSTRDVPASQLAALSDLIASEQIPGIFINVSSNDQIVQLADTIAREQGGDFFVVRLYIDGPGRTEATTYLEMMRYDVAAIVSALMRNG